MMRNDTFVACLAEGDGVQIDPMNLVDAKPITDCLRNATEASSNVQRPLDPFFSYELERSLQVRDMMPCCGTAPVILCNPRRSIPAKGHARRPVSFHLVNKDSCIPPTYPLGALPPLRGSAAPALRAVR
jgi:hypothetical protein